MFSLTVNYLSARRISVHSSTREVDSSLRTPSVARNTWLAMASLAGHVMGGIRWATTHVVDSNGRRRRNNEWDTLTNGGGRP